MIPPPNPFCSVHLVRNDAQGLTVTFYGVSLEIERVDETSSLAKPSNPSSSLVLREEDDQTARTVVHLPSTIHSITHQ
jgi:hypothetical protein